MYLYICSSIINLINNILKNLSNFKKEDILNNNFINISYLYSN
jgi:hypothetical protein